MLNSKSPTNKKHDFGNSISLDGIIFHFSFNKYKIQFFSLAAGFCYPKKLAIARKIALPHSEGLQAAAPTAPSHGLCVYECRYRSRYSVISS